MEGDHTRGHSRTQNVDTSGESGWVTTEVAAKAVRVSPRTIRRYIDRGELEAKPQGEGVHRTWLVSVDSLHALRAARTVEEERPQEVRVAEPDSMADVFRELAARLEQRAAEAAELRTRLELTERSQSTLEEELREVRRERDELRRQLEARTEASEAGAPETATEGLGNVDTAPAGRGPQEPSLRESRFRSWWRRNFLASMVGLMTAFGVLHASGLELPVPTAPEPRSSEQATATKPQALPPAPAPEPAPSAPEPAPPPPELAPPPEPVPATKPTPVVEQPTPVAEQPTPVVEQPAPTD